VPENVSVDVEANVLHIVLVIDRVVVTELLVDYFWCVFRPKKLKVQVVFFLVLSVALDLWRLHVKALVQAIGDRRAYQADDDDQQRDDDSQQREVYRQDDVTTLA